MRPWTLVIPLTAVFRWPVSPNHRMFWAKKAKINAEWRQAVYAACQEAQIPHQTRVEVTVTFRTARGPLRDHDNLVASCKAIVDGLVGCWLGKGKGRVFLPGILDHDGPEYLTLTVREERVKVGQEAVELQVSEIEE